TPVSEIQVVALVGCPGRAARPRNGDLRLFPACVTVAPVFLSGLASAIALALRIGKPEDRAWNRRLRGQVPRLAAVSRARKVVEDPGARAIAAADDAVPTITGGDRQCCPGARAA